MCWLARIIAAMALCICAQTGFAAEADNSTGPLTIGVYIGPPYAQVDAAGAFSGRSIELWHRVAQTRGYSYRLVPVKQMAQVLEGVRSREFDVAIGAITVTPGREKLVDFSHPTHPSGAAVAVRSQSGFAGTLNVLRSSASELAPLLLGLVGLLALLGSIIWWLERREEATPTKVTSVSEGMYWAAVTMATVGYGDKTPKTGSGRTLAVIWMFTSILLTSMFTATIIAKLTATQINPSLNATTDLQDKRLAAMRDASGAEFLTQNGLAHSDFPTLAEALASLQRGESDAVVHSRGALEYAVEQQFSGDLRVVPGVLQRTHMAFALAEGDPRKEELDQAIMQVLENTPAESTQLSLSGATERTW